MSRGVVLSLCDRTGNMVQPWLDNGYHAITVDLQPATNPNQNREHIIADVTNWKPPLRHGTPKIVFAFPPCTHLAVSGARWYQEKGMDAGVQALVVVKRLPQDLRGQRGAVDA